MICDGSKFNIKIHVKSETLARKMLYQLQKIGYVRILVFGLKLIISGTLTFNFIGHYLSNIKKVE
jgi:hypothetical protein